MRRYAFEQFAAVRNHSNLSFSPDGKWVAYATNASGQYNIWRQPVAVAPDSQPRMPIQLTALVDETARRAVWSPDGKRILTAADFHGQENFQLYEIPAESGWLYPITNDPKVRHEIGEHPFSPDGRYLAYSSNQRKSSYFDIVVYDLKSKANRIVMSDDANYLQRSWSPDGRYLLVLKFNNNMDQDLFLCDVKKGKSRHLTPHDGEIKFFPGPWSPDGRGFYLISDQSREFLGLTYFNLHTNSLHWLETPDWDIQDIAMSLDGQSLAWIVNEDGYSRLFVRNLATKNMRQFSQLPPGVYHNLCFSPANHLLGLYISRPVRPAELYILNIETGEFWKLTQSFVGGISETDMVEPELIRYPTHDEREIPAFLYKPKTAAAGKRAPVVLVVHGGPQAQEMPSYNYNGLYQYLLYLGIGILAPNFRGSTGYGKSYQKLIQRDWGGAELKDLEYAALYLGSLNWVDPHRLGVFGGSFGGFATLSCVTRLSEYWAAAVDLVGPSNLITFMKAVPPFWRRFMKQWVGDPVEDAELLDERSPINYIDKLRAPLLVIQGANDPRVVKNESDQMVARLKKLKREVEYMVFEDEGHNFTKTTNLLKALKASADWFETHLLH
jgi:dipeptidyl aminopeptidase/acylaminoacyl peptidase